jgi:HEAT repeat protein
MNVRRETGNLRGFEAIMRKLGLSGWVVTAVLLANPATPSAMPCTGDVSAAAAAYEPAESARLTKAKDFIIDEQWFAAINELRQAVDDAKERNRDEALFWLAHSQNMAGDLAEAVESIRRLQREFKKSAWSAPASSLMIELAYKLGRQDVLWRMVPPPPPPAPVGPVVPPPPSAPRKAPAHRVPTPPAPPKPPSGTPPAPPAPLAPPAPPKEWIADTYAADADLRIQVLGRLIRTDAQKVIPMLGEIALEEGKPAEARRAVFVLAQSGHPEARTVVVDVAKKGPQAVRIAAVKELGHFGGPEIAKELLMVYSTADPRVKRQVVTSLGQRNDANALFKIAQSENNPDLRETAVIALGRAGGRDQLRLMYTKAPIDVRYVIVRGLFTARDDDGLIRICEEEKEPRLRVYATDRLRLMGTARAREYLLEKTK